MQPPSRGCVLKQLRLELIQRLKYAAAFARLCVETKTSKIIHAVEPAAAFARLCVETPYPPRPFGRG